MWNDLTMSERADVIKMAVKAGLRDMKSIRDFYDNSLKYADGGPKTNNREQDKPQISWMKNWLSSRKDILRKNAEATTWGYTKYSPKRNEGDVRESGWHGVSYENPWNPITYLKGSTPTENRINKIIYSQIENADDTPKQEVGYGSSNSYNMRGIYVEPNYWNNTGNYIAFAGQNVNPETKIHEFTHASHPEQQEQYIDKIIFKGRTPNVVPRKKQSSRDNAKELYGALQEFRYKNNLKPEQIIDQEYIDSHRELFKDNYLENIPDEYKIKLFNDVAQNNSPTQQIERDSIQPLLLKDGGSIHISPSKRGTFTAAATKHGMGVQEFASKVLANKDNYSPAMVKKANFAKNASKWKHCLGGYLFEEGGPKVTYGKPYYSYDKNMQIETDNGKPILNYSATLPEVSIIPDSKKSPADRNADERFRYKTFSDYAERKDKEYTQRQIMKSQRDWDNSLEKKALGYAQDFMTGIGIGADIVSGLPVYSSLKGSRVLSEANSLPEYIEGGLWLAPIGSAVGKEAYNVGKNAWNTNKNAIKNTIRNIGKNSEITPVDFSNLTPEQWTAAQDAAIAKGNMAEAQRLRDLHAEIKGYNPIHEYHGSNKSFKEFKESPYGIYFTPDKSAAEGYARGFSPTKYDVYLNSGDDVVTIDNDGLPWNKISETKAADAFGTSKEDLYSIVGRYNAGAQPWYYDYLYPFGFKPKTKTNYYAIDQLAEAAKQQGKTSLKLINATDNGKKITAIKNRLYDQHIVFNPNQIKSANVVTYDDNGIRIPLGERDNFKINDFRYGIIPLVGGASLYKNKRKVK